MSCNITSGITTGCNTGIGGVKTVWLANSTSGPWYKYEMDKETASLVETYNVNRAGSILGFTQTLTIQLNKMAADKQQEIALIAKANGMQVQVETNDGTGFQFGQERGAYLASGTTTSGTAYTDTNQSELVIQADSKEPMSVVIPGQIGVGYYFHLGIGTYPYTQDLINGTWYKHDDTIAANFADGFADALANPSFYETIDTIPTPLVDGYIMTYETSIAQNFYWLLIPDAWGIPDLTLEGHLRDIQNPVADVAAAKLATTVNGQSYTLYKLNLLSTIQPVTIEYVD